jgi:hypothetical protein
LAIAISNSPSAGTAAFKTPGCVVALATPLPIIAAPTNPAAPTAAVPRNLLLDIEPALDPALLLLEEERLTFLAPLRTLLLLAIFSPRFFLEVFDDLLELDLFDAVFFLVEELVLFLTVDLLAFAVDFTFLLFRAPEELFFLVVIYSTSYYIRKHTEKV